MPGARCVGRGVPLASTRRFCVFVVLAGALQTPHPMAGYFGVYPARMAGALAPLQKFCKRQIGENGSCRSSANVKLGKMALAEVLQMSSLKI